MQIKGFDWDRINIEHIARHGVEPGEAEEIFEKRVLRLRSWGGRYILFGQTAASRYLAVVIRIDSGIVRVVTVRGMTFSEKRRYKRGK
ncbi:BrnT family toxin [Elusimicrobiota bacterium]